MVWLWAMGLTSSTCSQHESESQDGLQGFVKLVLVVCGCRNGTRITNYCACYIVVFIECSEKLCCPSDRIYYNYGFIRP